MAAWCRKCCPWTSRQDMPEEEQDPSCNLGGPLLDSTAARQSSSSTSAQTRSGQASFQSEVELERTPTNSDSSPQRSADASPSLKPVSQDQAISADRVSAKLSATRLPTGSFQVLTPSVARIDMAQPLLAESFQVLTPSVSRLAEPRLTASPATAPPTLLAQESGRQSFDVGKVTLPDQAVTDVQASDNGRLDESIEEIKNRVREAFTAAARNGLFQVALEEAQQALPASVATMPGRAELPHQVETRGQSLSTLRAAASVKVSESCMPGLRGRIRAALDEAFRSNSLATLLGARESEMVASQEVLWCLEQTFVICAQPNLADWAKYEGRVPMLDVSSVRTALDELNRNADLCPGGICVVFSLTRQIYTVLYRRGLDVEARKTFGLKDGLTSTQSPTAQTAMVAASAPLNETSSPRSSPRRLISQPLEASAPATPAEPEVAAGFMGRLQAFVATRITAEKSEPEQPTFDPGKLIMTRCIALKERYDILNELGTGVQGTTYLVRRKGSEQDCVAKETKNTKPEGVKAFMAEFSKMRDFRHPNCIKVIELLEYAPQNQLFIISELASGGDLYKYMEAVQQETSELTEGLIAGLFYQAMAGVAFLHTKGCMHNDLKPDNILVMEQYRPGRVPRVVVADYGCATLRTNRRQVMFGDPRYQAPESLRAMLAYFKDRSNIPEQQGPKADVWSMGATLYELLSGGIIPFLYTRCPDKFAKFDDERWVKLREVVLSPQRVEVFRSCSSASDKAEGILLRLLEKDASKRPTAQDALADPWFAVQGGRLSCGILANVEFTATKSKARQILLNALATRMKTDHVRHCYKIFHSFDREKCGTISRSDFKQALETLGQDTCNADAIFERADVDGSGSLEFNEFVAMTYDWREEQKTGKLDEYLKDFLGDLGAKEDGTISKEGLRTFFNGVLKPEELEELEHLFNLKDKQDIGPADLKDYISMASFFVGV
mmetsp:Transcript_156606/g.300363  ORF Transcript_156606/g.300363 Transcript_156606/m.300363 type:complete len:955 (-) Transcript_156606:95-2959(-)